MPLTMGSDLFGEFVPGYDAAWCAGSETPGS